GCGRVLVLADSEEIAAEVRSFGGEVWLTDPELESGTARIASVAERLGTEIVVNLQGDAPLTDPAVVARCARAAAASGAPVPRPGSTCTASRCRHRARRSTRRPSWQKLEPFSPFVW